MKILDWLLRRKPKKNRITAADMRLVRSQLRDPLERWALDVEIERMEEEKK